MGFSSFRFIACVALSTASGTSAFSKLAQQKSHLDSWTTLPSTSSTKKKAPSSGYLDSLGPSSSSKTPTNVATPSAVTKTLSAALPRVRKKEVTGIVGPGRRGFLLLIFLLLTTLAQFFLPLPKEFFDHLGQNWALPEIVEKVSQPPPINAPLQVDGEVQDLDEWAF